MWYLDDSEPASNPIDLTTTESEVEDTQIEIVVPTEPEGDVLDYIVDVATTKRSLNNGPDIARHCIQQGQTSVHLNNLPLNGTNIYIRVWSKRANGDWVYEDYELETEAKTPATKQVTRSYIVSDHLDTPRFIYDDEKALTWRWASDGFGRQAADDDPDGDGYQVNFNLGFPGQYDDLESGLVYNWNRYYDSEIGRYVTSDPIGVFGGLNTYAYVGGNPLALSDRTGLKIEGHWILTPAIRNIRLFYPESFWPFSADGNNVTLSVPTSGTIYYKIGCKETDECGETIDEWEIGNEQDFQYTVNLDQPIPPAGACSYMPKNMKKQCLAIVATRAVSKAASKIKYLARVEYGNIADILASGLDPTNMCMIIRN
jgi:RHS repeat-associated protein